LSDPLAFGRRPDLVASSVERDYLRAQFGDLIDEGLDGFFLSPLTEVRCTNCIDCA
jgi:hypothetical protein